MKASLTMNNILKYLNDLVHTSILRKELKFTEHKYLQISIF